MNLKKLFFVCICGYAAHLAFAGVTARADTKQAVQTYHAKLERAVADVR